MSGFEKSISTLEFERIREMLAALASTEGAKKLAHELVPETRIDKIRTLIKQTSDAKMMSQTMPF